MLQKDEQISSLQTTLAQKAKELRQQRSESTKEREQLQLQITGAQTQMTALVSQANGHAAAMRHTAWAFKRVMLTEHQQVRLERESLGPSS